MTPVSSEDRPDQPDFLRGIWLAGVIAMHALVLAWAPMGLGKPVPPVVKPTVIGMLIVPPAPAIAPDPPKLKSAPPVSRPNPRPHSKPKPLPPAPPMPPSERTVTVPPPPADAPATLADQDLFPVAHQPKGMDTASASTETAALGSSETSEGLPVAMPRTDAAHLNNPAPQYPALSRRFGEQGRVLLDVYILPDGTVGEITLNQSSGFARLDDAALQAVRHWRYVPARRGNAPIPYWYVQPITFSLNR